MKSSTPSQSQLQLITQSFDQITVAAGEVPVLSADHLGKEACAAITANFLRSGTRAVQILGGAESDRKAILEMLASLRLKGSGEDFSTVIRPQVMIVERRIDYLLTD